MPFLTVLAPSERYHQQRKQRHKQLTDWARQMISQVRHWLPGRLLVVVADSSYAALHLLAAAGQLPQPVTMITRLRLDAALYEPAPARTPRTRGAPRKKGARLPTLAEVLNDRETAWALINIRWYGGATRQVRVSSARAIWYHSGLPPVPIRWVLITDPAGKFESQALLSTDQKLSARQKVEWFVLRWQLEVTFEEARPLLGIETQRQWSDLAIERTTPTILGLFSLISLFAHQLLQGQELAVRQAAWYPKRLATFSDTLALVRQQLWPVSISWLSGANPDVVIIPKELFNRLTDTLAFAA